MNVIYRLPQHTKNHIEELMQDFAQSLHRIQQDITLPDHRVVLRILQRWPVRLNDPVHLIDCAV